MRRHHRIVISGQIGGSPAAFDLRSVFAVAVRLA
jgi:hypothetical protein